METIRPEEFFTPGIAVPERIMGTEVENLVWSIVSKGQTLPDGTRIAEGFAPAPHHYIASAPTDESTLITASGAGSGVTRWDIVGKGYEDCGLLEMSTNEGRGPQQTTALEWAGIATVRKLITTSPYAALCRGAYRQTGIHKLLSAEEPYNATSTEYSTDEHTGRIIRTTTTGRHPNALIPRALFSRNPQVLQLLTSALATAAGTWNGAVGSKGYEWSQKQSGLSANPDRIITTSGIDLTDHGNKPMVYIRGYSSLTPIESPRFEDTCAGQPDWLRCEIRAADAPQNRTSAFLGNVIISLTLRLAEHWDDWEQQDRELPDLESVTLRNPAAAMQALATSRWLDTPLTLNNGEQCHADELQARILYLVKRFMRQRAVQLPPDEILGLPLWEQQNTAMHSVRTEHELQPLAHIADNARKYLYLERLPDARGNLTIYNPQAVAHSLHYDCIYNGRDKSSGPGLKLAQRGIFAKSDETYVPQALVDRLLQEPPADTRAAERIAFIRQQVALPPEKRTIIGLSWSGITTNERHQPKLLWPNPYGHNS